MYYRMVQKFGPLARRTGLVSAILYPMTTSSGDGRKRATIRDVSALSGVSIGTVSNVINAPEVVAEATRRKVEEAIAELGYAPAAAARSLKSRRAFMVGYPIYDSDSGSIMRRFFREFLRRAETHGLGVQAFAAEPDDYETSFTRLLDSGSVDGFILSTVSKEDPRIEWMMANDIPFVGFGRDATDHEYPCVDIDATAGARLIARHVLDLGHTRIAYVGWDAMPANTLRLEGITQELAAAGHELVDAVTSPFSVDGAEEATARLLELPDPPTAILCGQDTLGAGALRAAHNRDLTVGNDLVIAGFDGTPLGLATSPSLTSVSFPMDEVANLCVDLLVGRLQDEPATTVLLQPELVVRESTSAR